MSKEVSRAVLHIQNKNEQQINAHSVKIGIPLPRGVYHANHPPQLIKASGEAVSTISLTATTFWPDNSYQWVMAEGTISVPSESTLDLFVHGAPPRNADTQRNSHVSENDDTLRVHAFPGEITFSKSRFANFAIDNLLKAQHIQLKLSDSQSVVAKTTSIAHSTRYCVDTPVLTTVTQTGSFVFEGNTIAIAELESSIYLSTGEVRHRVTLTNPRAAKHPNGQWDLGDHNSLKFAGCYWEYEYVNQSSEVTLHESATNSNISGSFALHQESSGKTHWNSPVHVDQNNTIPFQFSGFRCTQNHSVAFAGGQAEPLVAIKHGEHSIAFRLPSFWQNFPADIQNSEGNLSVSILGSSFSQETELQPGEQKSREFVLEMASTAVAPPELKLHSDWVRSTAVLPLLTDSDSSATFQELIQQGVEGKNSFFEKREAIDEFGWRHFGELYADHEIPAQFKGLFVSHYNNQYDPVFGMLCQWLITGNQKWFILADELAKHVSDIDVYHTSEDKPEYSGGLFWHTDHYVQAYTATHRTYSSQQPKDVYEDHAGGGGPGGQHCYTNGLLLHYLITGHSPSRKALLTIADWITRVYEGDNTLLSLLLSMKNRNRADLKNIVSGKYPLDRGTANYIHAILDRFALTQHSQDLAQVEYILFNTLSAEDDLASRHLNDVENTWFYTVLLQALCRYISVKHSIKQDGMLIYAIDALKHYANWMLENEDLSLKNPEILEFPNETWSAQDLRKLCILSFAKPFMENKEQVQNKIHAMESDIIKRLENSEESSTTRLLCLMMQNANYDAYEHSAVRISMSLNSEQDTLPFSAMHLGLTDAVKKTIRQFNLRHELTQFKRRFPAKWKANDLV